MTRHNANLTPRYGPWNMSDREVRDLRRLGFKPIRFREVRCQRCNRIAAYMPEEGIGYCDDHYPLRP